MKTMHAPISAALLCGLTAFSSIALSAERRLETAAIRKAVLGRTVSIVTPTLRMNDLRLERTGTIRHASGERKIAGSWSASKDMLCLDISKAIERTCMTVIRHSANDRRLFLFTHAGEPFGEVVLAPSH
jgi:hypothetical protein